MLLVIGAIVAGILIGVALGGSLTQLAEIRLRWWGLALLGLAFQLAPIPSLRGRLDHWLAVGLLIASYVVLLVFVVANIRLPGFWLIAAGFLLNVMVISINAGMPVSRHALQEAYGSDYPAILADLERSGGAKHHLERPSDTLRPLTDVIALAAPVHLVLSAGDVLFFLGVTWVIAAATKGPPGRHRAPAERSSSRALDGERDRRRSPRGEGEASGRRFRSGPAESRSPPPQAGPTDPP